MYIPFLVCCVFSLYLILVFSYVKEKYFVVDVFKPFNCFFCTGVCLCTRLRMLTHVHTHTHKHTRTYPPTRVCLCLRLCVLVLTELRV